LGQYQDGVVPQDQQAKVYQDMQFKQYEIMQISSLSNSIFEAASQAQMNILKATESQMDQETANLESQLKLMREELTSVEKGETEAAKSEAPKFGLS